MRRRRGHWSRYVLPRIIDLACGTSGVSAQRREVVPLASGQVLEIGMGTGHNLRWYDPERVERVIGLDPAEEMLERARRRSAPMPFPVEHLALEGERIPLDAASVDTVVVTFTLCSIPGVETALAGMRRCCSSRKAGCCSATWPGARRAHGALAGSSDPGLALRLRWLSSEP